MTDSGRSKPGNSSGMNARFVNEFDDRERSVRVLSQVPLPIDWKDG
jgi:hypothetical protein